jgi:hypothetical protein
LATVGFVALGLQSRRRDCRNDGNRDRESRRQRIQRSQDGVPSTPPPQPLVSRRHPRLDRPVLDEPSQLARHEPGRREPVLRVFLQRLQNDGFQIARNPTVNIAQGRRSFGRDLMDQPELVGRLEHRPKRK